MLGVRILGQKDSAGAKEQRRIFGNPFADLILPGADFGYLQLSETKFRTEHQPEFLPGNVRRQDRFFPVRFFRSEKPDE